ncbi:metallophosphoesterase [Celeribacter neptunius]|nr:metallophosphoesterase [Celeribacter neptunius]
MLRHFWKSSDPATLRPDRSLAVIGDIHGRADLLERALTIAEDRQIICVGDYVDRGPDSAAVLDILYDRTDIISLAGNHEEMMLRFLDEPLKAGPGWLKHGGLSTLESYGESLAEPPVSEEELIALRDFLADRMGPEMITWLRELPLQWLSGNLGVVHAGADPRLPFEEQERQVLLWGHPKFGRKLRKDGIWVVRGHAITGLPNLHKRCISIDTGAYATGRLTVALIDEGDLRFETVSFDERV